MGTEHDQRHRPPRQRGGNVPPAAVPVRGRRSRWRVAFVAVLGAIALGGWLAQSAWRHSGQRPTEPAAPGPARAKMPADSPRAQPASGAAQEAPGLSIQMKRANELLAQGKPAEAEQVLTEAMRWKPLNEDLHYNLGLALARQGKFEEATQQYGEALRIFPDYAEAHNNLGNALMRLGRIQEAAPHFERAVKIMPDYAAAHNNLGTALQQLGRASEALAQFREAVKLAPDYWQARFNLGMNYMQAGRAAEARSEFETVLREQPGFEAAKSALAKIQARQSGSE